MATAASSLAQGRDVRDEDEASRVFAAVVAQQAKVSGFSGSALVARGSKTLYRGSAGSANMESRAPNRPSTKYRIGSLTKQFTAALVMQLVDAGELDLDAAVTRYLEDYRADTGDRITLRHLLTHSSGLPNYTDDPDLRVSMRQATTVVAFVASACSGDLEFEPGTAVKYCNSGYFLLGAILEEVTGQRYDTLLRARILDPLDLTGTGYDRHRAVIVGRARGHERIGGVLVPSEFLDMSKAFAAGALYSTVDDLAQWSQALTDGRVMSEASRTASLTRQVADYGYGWVIRNVPVEPGRSVLSIGHRGSIPGFRSAIRRFPENDGLIVVLSNCRQSGATGQLV